jgi:hypothetical protein
LPTIAFFLYICRMTHIHYVLLFVLGFIGLVLHVFMKLSLAWKKQGENFKTEYFLRDNSIDWLISILVLITTIVFITDIVNYVCATPCKNEFAIHKLIAFTAGFFNTDLLRKFKQLMTKKINNVK